MGTIRDVYDVIGDSLQKGKQVSKGLLNRTTEQYCPKCAEVVVTGSELAKLLSSEVLGCPQPFHRAYRQDLKFRGTVVNTFENLEFDSTTEAIVCADCGMVIDLNRQWEVRDYPDQFWEGTEFIENADEEYLKDP